MVGRSAEKSQSVGRPDLYMFFLYKVLNKNFLYKTSMKFMFSRKVKIHVRCFLKKKFEIPKTCFKVCFWTQLRELSSETPSKIFFSQKKCNFHIKTPPEKVQFSLKKCEIWILFSGKSQSAGLPKMYIKFVRPNFLSEKRILFQKFFRGCSWLVEISSKTILRASTFEFWFFRIFEFWKINGGFSLRKSMGDFP